MTDKKWKTKKEIKEADTKWREEMAGRADQDTPQVSDREAEFTISDDAWNAFNASKPKAKKKK